MLILSRRAEESILVGENVRVKILRVGRGGQVRIGISAPREVEVWREELVLRAGGRSESSPPNAR